MQIRGFTTTEIEIDGVLHYGLPGSALNSYTSVAMHNADGVCVSRHRLPVHVFCTPGDHAFRTGGHNYKVHTKENARV